jgi:hypothetical protein
MNKINKINKLTCVCTFLIMDEFKPNFSNMFENNDIVSKIENKEVKVEGN